MCVWYHEGMILDGLITVPEAAKLAGRNPETIRRWIRSGRLPAHKVGTQHLIEDWRVEEIVHGIRAVGLPEDTTPEHRAYMDGIVRMIREDRDSH